MRIVTLILLLSSLLFEGCMCNKVKEAREKMTEATKDLKNTKEVFEGYKDIAKNAQKSMDEMEEFAEMRRKKGDTIAMDYQALADFMPEIKNYIKLEPKGQKTKVGGISYSTCTQKYERVAEDGSKEIIEIQLVDYNGTPSMYGMATALLNTDMEIESDSESLKKYPTRVDYVSAIESVKKRTGKTTITTGIAYRFFGTIKADSQEAAQEAFEGLPLNDMSKL